MGPISHILINNFKYGTDDKDLYGTTMLLTYHSIFYAQGMLTSIWFKILEEYLYKFTSHKFFPFFLMFFYLCFGFLQPANYSEVGFLYFYPLYDNTYI